MHLPVHLLKELSTKPGFDVSHFTKAHNQPAPTSVRLHPVKGTGVFEDMERVPWCSNGLYLPERPVFTLDPLFHAGAYYVQEASSMFLHKAMTTIGAHQPAMRILDLCAAPGGKSTLIASLLHPDSLLIANEVIRTRASILEENTSRWGYMNNWVTSNDPREIGKLEGFFDVIVIDAPCSGSGLWRKDPNALNEWSEENVLLCSSRQKRIVADVWPALKQGGYLVYATCSYSVAEDEEITDWIARTYNAEGIVIPDTENWNVEQTQSKERGIPGYHFYPHKLRGEGFFLSVLKKQTHQHITHATGNKWLPDKKIQNITSKYFGKDDITIIPAKEGNYNAISTQHIADWQLLQKSLWLRRTGTAVGMPMSKDWIPDHELALCVDTIPQPALDVNREQALKFLKREEMGTEMLEKGWFMVRYKGLGLGWVKSVGNRYNNYLPKHWRIRMSIEE